MGAIQRQDSLRGIGQRFGVGVQAVCPNAIEACVRTQTKKERMTTACVDSTTPVRL